MAKQAPKPPGTIVKTTFYKIVGDGDIEHGKNRVDYWDNQYGFQEVCRPNPHNRRETLVSVEKALDWLESQEWMTLGDYRRIKKGLKKYRKK